MTLMLDQAIEAVYSAFAPIHRRQPMARCTHCVGEVEQLTLDRTPLRDLTADRLNHFAFSAMNTWGDANDYKHFVPRILELAASPDASAYPGLDIDLVCGKLAQASWASWSLPEQSAVSDYFMALWRMVLHSDPDASAWNAGDVLRALEQSFSDPSPFLAAWESDDSLSAALQLAELLQLAWSLIARRKSVVDKLPYGALLHDWLTSPARLISLERTFEDHLEHPASSRLAAGIDAWRWIRESREPR
jgi:hypothetical protein